MDSGGGVSRREFLTGAFRSRNLALAATGGLAWSHVLGESRETRGVVRPPGARPELEFVATCTKCGQCVEACPFDTLELATAADDAALGTPYFEPRRIPCYMCEDTPCITACPSGSLASGTAIEDARMGVAVLVDQESCLAFQGLRCEVCYRACPLVGRAIRLDLRPGERPGQPVRFLPLVESESCTGCGMCERACVIEKAAIVVLPLDQVRGSIGAGRGRGWTGEPVISRDFDAPDAPPDVPAFRGSPERALREINDLEGIEGP